MAMASPSSSSSPNQEEQEKRVFVTVGTTLFDPLIEAVTCHDCLVVLAKLGYTHMTIQYGKGCCPSGFPSDGTITTITTDDEDNHGSKKSIQVETYSFKPTLQDDIQRSTLMISHAGAGSIMEGLEVQPQRKLLVVINPSLMNNHQSELGEALSKRGYLWHLSQPNDLSTNHYDILKVIDRTPITDIPKWPKGDSWAFPKFLDSFMGFHNSHDEETKSTQQQTKEQKKD